MANSKSIGSTKVAPLDEARIAILRHDLQTYGIIALTRERYREYADHGISHQQLDRAGSGGVRVRRAQAIA